MGETATNSESKMCKKYFSSKDKLVINEDSNFCEMFHHFQMIFPCSEKCWTRRWPLRYCKILGKAFKNANSQGKYFIQFIYDFLFQHLKRLSQRKVVNCRKISHHLTNLALKAYSSTESKFCTAVPSNMIHVIEILQEDLTHPKIFVPLQKAIEDCSIDEQRNFFIALREAEEYQSNENEINSL